MSPFKKILNYFIKYNSCEHEELHPLITVNPLLAEYRIVSDFSAGKEWWFVEIRNIDGVWMQHGGQFGRPMETLQQALRAVKYLKDNRNNKDNNPKIYYV